MNKRTKNTQETQHVSISTASMSYNKYRLLSAYRGKGVDLGRWRKGREQKREAWW